MITVKQMADYAQIAQAAYAKQLVWNANNVERYKIDAGMSASQAEQFDANWIVLEQSSPTLNGLSAVLLQNAVTGEKVLAIAGTDGATDLWADYEYIFQVNSISGMGQFQSLEAFYQQLIADSKLTAAEQIVITGHSLGGFLAQAFTAVHANIVSAAYTFNAPGFGGAGEELLDYLGIGDGSVANSKITNVIAADGGSVTAGLGVTLGATVRVGIEAATAPWDNHQIGRLADALALQSLLATMDGSLRQATFNAVLKEASKVASTSLELLLDAVRVMLLGPVGSTATDDGGEAYYQNLQQLRQQLGAGGSLQALAGALRVGVPSVAMAGDARVAFSTLVALQESSAIVLNGATPANQAVLDAAMAGGYSGLYAQWQSDQSLSAADRAAGRANFSDEYLAARTQYVLALADARGSDVSYSPTVTSGVVYEDVGTGTVLGSSGNPVPWLNRQIIFGSDGADTLTGGTYADQLFGGGGDDRLVGGEGNDLLDGSAGNDILEGGSGTTIAHGGTGDDTYRYYSGDGLLNIADGQGSNLISINLPDRNYVLGNSSLTKVSDTADAWTDSHGNRFVLSNATLHVQLEDGGAIAIENFASGDFGISLGGTAPVTPPVGTSTFTVGAPNQNLGLQDAASINAVGTGHGRVGGVQVRTKTDKTRRSSCDDVRVLRSRNRTCAAPPARQGWRGSARNAVRQAVAGTFRGNP
jgi:hypothetical protein